MTYDSRLDEKITASLQRDEAVVLLWYVTREVWKKDADNNLNVSLVRRRTA